jgi:serine/threonine-protein kinase HipA
MGTPVKVYLWDDPIAVLDWNKEKDYGVLEILSTFIQKNIDLAPLTMPLQDLTRGEKIFYFPELRTKTFKGLPGLIADSLPDDYGNTIIDAWFSSKNLTVNVTPLDRLCYIGKRGMGALEYKPFISDKKLDQSSQIEITELIELADQILKQREHFQQQIRDDENGISDILKVGTSAGGAKPKAIIALNDKTKEVRSGQVKAPKGFQYWIVKFDGVEGGKVKDNPIGMGRIEYAYYKMAVDCGINMTECRLWEDHDRAHFMTKRFDRSETGDKIHTQTWCAIAHYDRDERYSYEQLFKTIRQLHLSASDVEQMFRRMVFNVIARNHDDHTKNHSFIMDKSGNWSLAPAYDVCYSYSSSGTWTNKHQLSLNGKRDNFTRDDLLQVGKNMDIKNPEIILEQTLDIVNNWSKYAKNANVRSEHIQQIENNLIRV